MNTWIDDDAGPVAGQPRPAPPARVRRFKCAPALAFLSWGLLALISSGACSPRDQTKSADGAVARVIAPPEGPGLAPVTLPDPSAMQAGAKEQLEARAEALRAAIAGHATASSLAAAYGDMGKLLMAATFLEAAEPCYLNARTLAPDDRRWPYYLGHLYRVKGPLSKAVEAFERALALKADDVATLVWLGDVHLAEGRAEAAEPLFAKAVALDPAVAAAHFGLGRAALGQDDHATAVKALEQALAREPRATVIHYQLAMAYRGLGDVRRAEAHLARQGDVEARPPDPLMREIDDLLQTAEAYNVRGGAALDAGNWSAAAEAFRKGLELAPKDPSLRHRLGTALYQLGDLRGAEDQFTRVASTSPQFTRAHYSLGVLLNATGRYGEAIERFSTALQQDPKYVQARVQLAGVLARSGRPGEALTHYARALEIAPGDNAAAFGQAMALVRLKRYDEAYARLVEAGKSQPDSPIFKSAQARLLAAAPDDRVRNGPRAQQMVDELLKSAQSIELGETAAMALAERGLYAPAAAVQRDLIAAAQKAGIEGVLPRLTANLRLYENGQACRTPFTEDELP
jgi:tetratricopeptide (TPR) repeat protein